jgi:hypothetical protein
VRAVVHIFIHGTVGGATPAVQAGARFNANVFDHPIEEIRIAVTNPEGL